MTSEVFSDKSNKPRRIVNATVEIVDNKKVVTPFSMQRILQSITIAGKGFPCRVADQLFIADGDGIRWLLKHDALLGWLGSLTGSPPDFQRSSSCHTAGQVFCELQATVKNYQAVETLPHEPKMQGHYYACTMPEPGDGSALDELVARYAPETEVDSQLIKAMLATPFWGGAGGTRPAFLVTADGGRGSGKTTLASHVGHLAGGTLDLAANEDSSQMKCRLLSTEGLGKRVALLDNIKSSRFSWAEFEALITATTISGKRLYHGEASRPNNLTWMLTLNGASLSKDVSQRCIIVKINRPRRAGSWAEETLRYIDTHREELIADCIGFLRRERTPLRQYSRWASWERAVLERLPHPNEAQCLILDRQHTADADADENSIIEDYFESQLSQWFNASTEQIFIPSPLAATWLSDSTGEKMKTVAACRKLSQGIVEGGLKRLKTNSCRAWGRGFVWIGDDADINAKVKTDIEARMKNVGF